MGSHVFGPVPSRRLGRSLGVDTVPFKTCSYDCIYCQLARTTHKTTERKEWVPLAELLRDVKAKLGTRPDYITLSGSGEPTLYARLEELIGGIKGMTDISVAVLTNGSLLWRPEVRRGLREADLVVPSLDAGSAAVFERINRPAAGLTYERMVEGLVALRREFEGQYWLEVFLVEGVNTGAEEIERLAAEVARIGPDRVQLNTVTRPPAEAESRAVAKERLFALAKRFGPQAEVIAEYQGGQEGGDIQARAEDIAELLSRRPCSKEEIADVFGLSVAEVLKYLEVLSAAGRIMEERQGDTVYYRASATV